MSWGDTLKKIRKEKGYTLDELAALTGITKKTLISYEKNDVIPRNLGNYRKLADALECDEGMLKKIAYASITTSDITKSISTAALLSASVAMGVPIASVAGAVLAQEVLSKNKNKQVQDTDKKSLEIMTNRDKFVKHAVATVCMELLKKGKQFTTGHKFEENKFFKPDEVLYFQDEGKTQILLCWDEKEFLKRDELPIREQVMMVISYLMFLVPDKNRIITFVINDNEIYNTLVAFKGNLSYLGNLSVNLIDADNMQLIEDTTICEYVV